MNEDVSMNVSPTKRLGDFPASHVSFFGRVALHVNGDVFCFLWKKKHASLEVAVEESLNQKIISLKLMKLFEKQMWNLKENQVKGPEVK